ncbi:MAG: hypothetical protein GY913_25185 [Proteobacteria bacterium]|nr:hypothetical protein [Pseudomonadota bacterium]MCP4920208.1 hypothetical protein [Pseudomonadota bacterium]
MPANDTFERFVADTAENTAYESHYLKANSPDGKRAFWIRHVLVCDGPTWAERYWEIWFLAFERGGRTWVGKAEYRWSQMEEILDGPTLSGPDVQFGPRRAVGKLGDMSWELVLGGGNPIRHLPVELLYSTGGNTKVMTPASGLRFAGEITLSDEVWPIDSWVGCRGHNWGDDYGDQYAWIAAHVWDDKAERSVEGFTGVLDAPLLGDTVVSRIVVKGAETASWTRPGLFSDNRLSSKGGRFAVAAHADSFVNLRYRSPSGDVLCRCTKFADVELDTPSGKRTSNCGELEFVDRSVAPGADAHPPASWSMETDGVYNAVV